MSIKDKSNDDIVFVVNFNQKLVTNNVADIIGLPNIAPNLREFCTYFHRCRTKIYDHFYETFNEIEQLKSTAITFPDCFKTSISELMREFPKPPKKLVVEQDEVYLATIEKYGFFLDDCLFVSFDNCPKKIHYLLTNKGSNPYYQKVAYHIFVTGDLLFLFNL